MSDAPIPFIAYFFITVTAGTLAYATYTDVGDNQETVTESKEEDSKEDNQELTNTNEEETKKGESEEKGQPPVEQQGVMPNNTEGAPPVVQAQPIESNNMQPQNESIQSLSNPFQKDQLNEPKKQENRSIFDGFGFNTKKGGKSKENKSKKDGNKTKKNISKKNKKNVAFEGKYKNIKEMRRLLNEYKKKAKIN